MYLWRLFLWCLWVVFCIDASEANAILQSSTTVRPGAQELERPQRALNNGSASLKYLVYSAWCFSRIMHGIP
jgi:hypothetical protein